MFKEVEMHEVFWKKDDELENTARRKGTHVFGVSKRNVVKAINRDDIETMKIIILFLCRLLSERVLL